MKIFILCAALITAAACGSDDHATRPTANAGFDQRAKLGTEAHLDGSASDENVTYAWTLAQKPDKSAALLTNADTATPSFTPDVVGPYMLALVVTRDKLTSEPDVVVISAYNGAPTSAPKCAAADCTVLHGHNGGLDARDSTDPDNDQLSYQWTQVATADQCATACPNLASCSPGSAVASIANATAALATFTAPNVASQNLVFALEVSDGSNVVSACVVYTTTDTKPVAALAPSTTAINPATIGENQVFTLSGAGSGDPDGDTLSYSWVEGASGYTAIISNPTNQATTVTAPNIPAATGALQYVDLSFTVTVSDGLETDTKTVNVRVTNDS